MKRHEVGIDAVNDRNDTGTSWVLPLCLVPQDGTQGWRVVSDGPGARDPVPVARSWTINIGTEVYGNRLTAAGEGRSETLRDYFIHGTLNIAAENAYTAHSRGWTGCGAILESTFLGGSVDFENSLAFEGIGENCPYAADLFVTGAMAPSGVGNSTLEPIAVDELCVDLRMDEDGDGGVDAAITTTWESLPTGIPVDGLIESKQAALADPACAV